jgi:hypothetical protein
MEYVSPEWDIKQGICTPIGLRSNQCNPRRARLAGHDLGVSYPRGRVGGDGVVISLVIPRKVPLPELPVLQDLEGVEGCVPQQVPPRGPVHQRPLEAPGLESGLDGWGPEAAALQG